VSAAPSVFLECATGGSFGTLSIEPPHDTLLGRFQQAALSSGIDFQLRPDGLEMPWVGLLSLLREFGPQQRSLGFQFRPKGDEARERIALFMGQYKQVQAAQGELTLSISEEEIDQRLAEQGFTLHQLKPFQQRDLARLLSLSNGANFSVPGAGKTTVTLALHLLTRQPGQHILIICPKAAFPAWRTVVKDFIAPDAPNGNAEEFTILSGSGEDVAKALASGKTRFVINYDLIINMPDVIGHYLATRPVHLVLDEAHRMKAGLGSIRGALLLNISPLPIRRDILTGTPMPQSAADLQSQLDFLWPGGGLGARIARGAAPRAVLGNLYVRTTKADLKLPKPKRHFKQVQMAKGQMALYGVVKSEFVRHVSSLRTDARVDLQSAKRTVMRLLQLSANPLLALKGIAAEAAYFDQGILEQVVAEGASTKMRAVADFARDLAVQGRKSVIWTIFTDTILQMERLLADLNPVTIYGATPTGEPNDPQSREGKLARFHADPACKVMIANPAAAGEGISLHKICHDAIYLDRSYVSTHYLQSIDRIHRLGLPENVDTNIWIFQTMAPAGLGCIDHSVSRRMAQKLRALQQLLDDDDLHEIALDEENADDPIAWDIDPEDVRDLVEELEGRTVWVEEDSA
jgi:SNF2 family DNA or RNA helicase